MNAEPEIRTKLAPRSIQRILRRILIFALVSAVAWFIWRYDFFTIPEDYPHLSPQHAPPGARVVLMDAGSSEELKRFVVVGYRPTDAAALCFGVLVGLPGESVEVEKIQAGVVLLQVGSHREELKLPAGMSFPSRVLQEDEYLVLNGDRAIGPGARHPDSRQFGPIRRSQIEKLMAPTFFFR